MYRRLTTKCPRCGCLQIHRDVTLRKLWGLLLGPPTLCDICTVEIARIESLTPKHWK
jgi:predicted RNA-binding Zn-ribbon protein involved in translation (DUF1610 family)